MIQRCICCLKRTKKLEDGYCPTCIKAGMKEVGDDYGLTLVRMIKDLARG